jgi:hypothetical protein
MEQTERSLVKKLAVVMQEVKYIQKTGYNKFHNYKYATEADVNEKVREELSKQDVIMIPNMKSHSIRTHTTAKGNTEYIVTVEVEFTFMDGDSGETISFTVFGEGQDAGDKATYKGITGAQKYALMKAFMIPTGDDPEADDGVDERNHGNTQKQDTKLTVVQTGAPASLKAKYQLWHESMDGFESWYAQQKQKFKDAQIEHWLQTQIQRKGASSHA